MNVDYRSAVLLARSFLGILALWTIWLMPISAHAETAADGGPRRDATPVGAGGVDNSVLLPEHGEHWILLDHLQRDMQPFP